MMGRAVAFTLLAACGAAPLPPGSDLNKFDSGVWKSVMASTTTARQEMLGDLVTNILPGKSETEVIALLGQPVPVLPDHPANEMVFYLGDERGNYWGNIDSEWLIVSFDKNKRYQQFIIHVD